MGGFKFSWRLGIWMILVALTPLIVMAYQGYHCARQAVVDFRQSQLALIMESKETKLSKWLQEVKADFRFLTEVPCVLSSGCMMPVEEGGLAGIQCGLLENLKRQRHYYAELMSYDSRWTLTSGNTGRISSDALPAGLKMELESKKEFILSAPEKNASGELIFYVGQRILDSQKKIMGYIAGVIRYSAIIGEILHEEPCPGRTTRIFLLDRLGRPLDRDIPEADGAVFEGGALGKITSGEQQFFEFTLADGRDVISVARYLPELNLTAVVQMDAAEAWEWLRILRNRAWLTGLVTFLLVAVLALKVSRRLSQPLEAVAAAARKISDGDLTQRISGFSGPEAAEVAGAFNKMMDELEANRQRIVRNAALAAVGELSSSIVHEMRNPLTTIKLNIQAVKSSINGDPVLSELAEIAEGQAARLEMMLSELLNYGKPVQFDLQALNIQDLIREAVALCSGEAQEKAVRILTDLPEETVLVTGDAEHLKRVLTNLILNGVQAAEAGGECGVILLNDKDKRMVEITVWDNGPGLGAGDPAYLFRPFVTNREGGTGLGLANVKKILELAGGTVTAKNRAPQGAEFTVRLPCQGVKS